MIKRFVVTLVCFSIALLAQAADLVYLNTPTGAQRLLQATLNQQYFAVQPFVDTQDNLAFCGPASMAAVLNSLPQEARPITPQLKPFAYFTQDSFFNPQTQGIKSREATLRSGLTLLQSAELLQSFGVKADRFYADQLSKSALRDLITSSLKDPKARLIINFNRKSLGQAGAGHLSPLAAYDAATDSVLILDVAKFKYPPFWVTITDLLNAMNTIDPDSGLSRGVIRVTAH